MSAFGRDQESPTRRQRATMLDDNLRTMSSQIQAGWHLAEIHHRGGDCADHIEKNSRSIDAIRLFCSNFAL
jgi:hypothetical protein